MSERRIEYTPLSALTRADSNPKTHDIPAIRRSFAEFGFVEAITIDERTGKLVAGHGRLAVLEADAKEGKRPPDDVAVDAATGEWLVPVQRGWSSRNDKQAAAYVIASNKIPMAGGFDDEAIARALAEFDGDLALATGFSAAEQIDLAALIAQPPRSENVASKYGPSHHDDAHQPIKFRVPQPVFDRWMVLVRSRDWTEAVAFEHLVDGLPFPEDTQTELVREPSDGEAIEPADEYDAEDRRDEHDIAIAAGRESIDDDIAAAAERALDA